MTKVLIALLSLSVWASAQNVISTNERPPATQSHPAWWMYASPDATALVGIQWSYLRSSPLAQAVTSELSVDGSLALPDFDFLRSSQQILIASPELMVLAYGSFPSASVKAMATAKGFKSTGYKSVELWVTPDKDTMSIARISDQLLLFGHLPTIKNAIDRNAAPMTRHNYSPLLAQAARYAKQDLWVVATRLPDPLASLFVPFDIEARGFEGSITVWDGFHAIAAIETGSGPAAEQTADAMWGAIGGLPAMADATQISTDGRTVLLMVDMDEMQFQSTLRRSDDAPSVASSNGARPTAAGAPSTPVTDGSKAAKPAPTVDVATAKPNLKSVEAKSTPPAAIPRDSTKELPTTPSAKAAASPVATLATTPVPVTPERPTEPEPARPLVIRIIGLEEGPREVALPPDHP